MCSECSATWLSTEDISPENADGPQSPDFRLSNLDCAIKGGASGWADLEEIKSMNGSGHNRYLIRANATRIEVRTNQFDAIQRMETLWVLRQ